MKNQVNLYQILCLIGIPSIIGSLSAVFVKSIRKVKLNNEALKLGIQALLRSEMIRDWNKYSELGYAPIYAKENFENCWVQYHALGANGVMNDIHDKFMDLPIK